jgi:hypothetical protein
MIAALALASALGAQYSPSDAKTSRLSCGEIHAIDDARSLLKLLSLTVSCNSLLSDNFYLPRSLNDRFVESRPIQIYQTTERSEYLGIPYTGKVYFIYRQDYYHVTIAHVLSPTPRTLGTPLVKASLSIDTNEKVELTLPMLRGQFGEPSQIKSANYEGAPYPPAKNGDGNKSVEYNWKKSNIESHLLATTDNVGRVLHIALLVDEN